MTAAAIALTIGDPNGIGPEVAVKAAAAVIRAGAAPPILVGDPAPVEACAARHGEGLRLRVFDGALQAGALNLLPVPALPGGTFRPGVVDAAAGAATIAYVEAALRLVRSGSARAIVACPHSETAVNAAGIRFAGYPGLLARLLGLDEDRVFLMLVGGGLRILHATLHERLADALQRLTPALVEAAGRAAADALAVLGLGAPRIGVFGINPHAGEGGLFGRDDEAITVPAVERLQRAGIRAEGPAGADVLLAHRAHDAFIAIYHDQGHIPVKLLAPRGAAALSVGGGVLFASVGHGSAFDIAGEGKADPGAVLQALRLLGGAAAAAAAPRA
jgi:4-hydroxy-L-threonine phosphate dehydrogenase PdxA